VADKKHSGRAASIRGGDRLGRRHVEDDGEEGVACPIAGRGVVEVSKKVGRKGSRVERQVYGISI
jgi:hypothetical protein